MIVGCVSGPDLYSTFAALTAAFELSRFEERWGPTAPMIATSWRANRERVVPFLDFPPEDSKVIYTTNAIDSLNSTLRKLAQYRGYFPTDECVYKLLYLALTNIEHQWDRSIRNWFAILGQFLSIQPQSHTVISRLRNSYDTSKMEA